MNREQATLEQALTAIADKLEAFRKPCPAEFGHYKRVGNGHGFDFVPTPDSKECFDCHGKGYLHREPWELADVLWKAGYYVHITMANRHGHDLIDVAVHLAKTRVGQENHRTGTELWTTLALATLQAWNAEGEVLALRI